MGHNVFHVTMLSTPMPTIRISEETKSAINELGNTFDSADDVLKKLIREAGYGELLGTDDVPERLIREAGHDELLGTDDEKEEMTKKGRSASEAKNWFTTQLESHPEITEVSSSKVKGNRDALDVVVDGETVRVWPKYSKFVDQDTPNHPPFYGSTWKMTEKLREGHQLYIAFLGPTENSCWVVPFEDFDSRFDFTKDANDGTEWKFNFEQGNSRKLLEEYSCIESLFE